MCVHVFTGSADGAKRSKQQDPFNVPPVAGTPPEVVAEKKYASTSFCRIVRHPVCAAVG